jgi:hypothetical protein
MDEIRALANSKDFNVRVLELDGQHLTVIGPAAAVDALVGRLAGDAVEVNRDQPRLEGYEQARPD